MVLEIGDLLDLTVLISPEELELLIGLSWLMSWREMGLGRVEVRIRSKRSGGGGGGVGHHRRRSGGGRYAGGSRVLVLLLHRMLSEPRVRVSQIQIECEKRRDGGFGFGECA